MVPTMCGLMNVDSHRSRWPAWILLSFLLFFMTSACHRPAPPAGITAAPIEGTHVELNALWESALSVLLKYDFQPDRQDRATGVITTFPTTSMQWHEPWRQDVVDAYSLSEASLHTIQRKATVRFVRENNWLIEVQIDVYRLSRPQTQITTASSVLHGFTGALPTSEGQSTESWISSDRWVHLRRDRLLEERILQHILNSAELRSDYSD